MGGNVVSRRIIRMRDRGRITIPAPLRDKYDLEEGTELVLVEEEDRLVIYPRRWERAEEFLDQIGETLRERGILLKEVLEDNEAIREEIFRERYPELAEKYEL